MYDTRGEISEWMGEMCATRARRAEAKNPSSRFQKPLPAKGDPAPPAGRCQPGGANAPPPDEMSCRRKMRRRFSGRSSDKEVAAKGQREKKTTWNTRRELSDGENHLHVPAKNNGEKKSRKNNRREAQPHPDDDEQLQGNEEEPGAPQNHAGGVWRYRARVDIC
ncbi:hypothetical protein C8R44DRAFT_862329 [Mycena epipterygia]|nr:hypothetical protein C8R44DRAFT_862329 [Mycena epipterygia]